MSFVLQILYSLCLADCIPVVIFNEFFCPCVSYEWVIGFRDWIRFIFEMYTHTHVCVLLVCVYPLGYVKPIVSFCDVL